MKVRVHQYRHLAVVWAMIILCGLSCFTTVKADTKKAIDSLKTELSKHTALDRVPVLLALTEQYVDLRSPGSLVYSKELLQLIGPDDDLRERGLYLITRGYLLIQNLDSAMIYQDSLRQWAETRQSNSGFGLSALTNGFVLIAQKKPEEAIKELTAAADFLQQEKQLRELSVTYNQLGTVYFGQGDYSNAVLMFERCVELDKQLNNLLRLGSDYSSLGFITGRQGKPEESINYLQQSRDIFLRVNDASGLANVTNTMGIYYARKGMLDESLSHFEQSRDAYKALGNQAKVIQSIMNIGIVYKEMGRLEESVLQYDSALKYYEAQKNDKGIALVLGNVSSLYQSLSKFEEALDMNLRAVEIYERLEDKNGMARAYNNTGATYNYLKRYEEGLRYLKKSLRIKEEIGQKSTIAISLNNIGGVYRGLKNLDSALLYFNKALAIKAELEDLNGIATTTNELGGVYKAIGDLDRALLMIDSSIVVSNQVGNLNSIREAQKSKADLLAIRGDFEGALSAYKLFKKAEDSLFTVDNEGILSKFQEEFKTKEQRQTILLLEQDKKIRQLWLFIAGCGMLILLVIGLAIFRLYQKNRKHADELSVKNKAIEAQSAQLKVTNSELEKLTDFRNAMTHMIAHDMKNSLNSIIGFSESDLFDRKMKQINQSGQVMLNLVANMLDVQKFEEAAYKPALADCQLSQLVDKARVQVALLFQSSSLSLDIDLPFDLKLRCDQEVIVRVLVNLLSNAAKYSRTGKTVFVKSALYTGEQEFAELSIKDEGQGMSSEQLERVFEKYWQGEANDSGVTASTGLGLTFCKLAIEAHQGTITVDSTPDVGTTFTIRIPIEQQEVVAQQISMAKEQESLVLDSERVLISRATAQLRDVEIYEVGEMSKVLEQLAREGVQSKWLNEVWSAIKTADRQKFEDLLKEGAGVAQQ